MSGESKVVQDPCIVVSGDGFPHHGMARIRRLNHPTEFGVWFTLQDNLGLTRLIDLENDGDSVRCLAWHEHCLAVGSPIATA